MKTRIVAAIIAVVLASLSISLFDCSSAGRQSRFECTVDADCVVQKGKVCDLTTHTCESKACKTCEDMGRECGEWDDGCGGSVGCGACAESKTCNGSTGRCETCTPDCGTRECGPVPNGCGRACPPGCSGPETCSDGRCVQSDCTYFLSPQGDDAGSGTSAAKAWKSLAGACERLVAGDTLCIMDEGIHLGQTCRLVSSGTEISPITITGFGAARPTLDGDRQAQTAIEVAGQSFVVITALRLINYSSAIRVTGTEAKSIRIENNVVEDVTDDALWLGATGSGRFYDVRIIGNDIFRSTSGDLRANIQLSGISDSRVSNNTIEDTQAGAIVGYGFSNVTIENNRIARTGWHGISGYDAHNNTVRNNNLTDIGGRGIRFDYDCIGNSITGNVLRNVADSGLNLYPGTSSIVEGNLFDRTSLYSDGITDTRFENNIWRCDNAEFVQLTGGTRKNLNVVFQNNTFVGCLSVWLEPMVDGVIRNNIFANSPLRFGGTGVTSYNDFWNSPVTGVEIGVGSIQADPLFVDAAGDFHVRSAGGHRQNSEWIVDAVTSPCVDTGDPASDYSNEPEPNGGRIEIGAYGNTPEASRSP